MNVSASNSAFLKVACLKVATLSDTPPQMIFSSKEYTIFLIPFVSVVSNDPRNHLE